MKRRVFRVFLVISIAALVFMRYTAWRLPQAEKDTAEKYGITLEQVKKLYPEAVSFDITLLDGEGAAVYDARGDVAGRFLCTAPCADNIKGYGGSVPMLVAIDKEGRVTGAAFLPNSESKNLISRIETSGFLKSWDGITAEEALGKKVDAVTGATMTCNAVIGSVRKRLSVFIRQEAPVGEPGAKWEITGILVSLAVLLALFSFFAPRIMGRYRLLLLVLNVIALGFLGGYMLSLELAFNWLLGGIARTVYPLLVIIAALSILLPLTTGRNFYCGYVCPYGCLQELVGRISRRPVHIPVRISGVLRKIRKIFLVIIVVVLLLGIDVDLGYIEPFGAFMFRWAASFTITLAVFFLGVSVFVPRYWCRFLCPTGQIIEFLTKKDES